jgi:hypothetical protein
MPHQNTSFIVALARWTCFATVFITAMPTTCIACRSVRRILLSASLESSVPSALLVSTFLLHRAFRFFGFLRGSFIIWFVARVIIAFVLISRHAGFLDDSDFSFEIYGALFKNLWWCFLKIQDSSDDRTWYMPITPEKRRWKATIAPEKMAPLDLHACSHVTCVLLFEAARFDCVELGAAM